MKLSEGRDFSRDYGTDSAAYLINETALAKIGYKDPIGKTLWWGNHEGKIIGILKDFQSATLFEPMQPLAIKCCKESKFQFLIVQAKPRDLTKVYSEVKDAWKRLYPSKPFNGFYQNQLKAEAYQATDSIATIFFGFALVSILLTATGLFALVSLTALKKMKEIALRKVVGAKPGHILVLINKGYFWIFIVSAMVGCYGGWALSRLLLDSIFKINAGVEINSLIGSVTVLFVIAAITSGIKVWQAVRANPVKLLRTE